MLPLPVEKGAGADNAKGWAMGRLEEAPPGFQGQRVRGSSSTHNAQPSLGASGLSCAQGEDGRSWRLSVPGTGFAAGAGQADGQVGRKEQFLAGYKYPLY